MSHYISGAYEWDFCVICVLLVVKFDIFFYYYVILYF